MSHSSCQKFDALQREVSQRLTVPWSVSNTGLCKALTAIERTSGAGIGTENRTAGAGAVLGLRKRKLMYARYIPVSACFAGCSGQESVSNELHRQDTLGAFGGGVRMLPGLSFKPEGWKPMQWQGSSSLLFFQSIYAAISNKPVSVSFNSVDPSLGRLPIKATVIADDIFWQIPHTS